MEKPPIFETITDRVSRVREYIGGFAVNKLTQWDDRLMDAWGDGMDDTQEMDLSELREMTDEPTQ